MRKDVQTDYIHALLGIYTMIWIVGAVAPTPTNQPFNPIYSMYTYINMLCSL